MADNPLISVIIPVYNAENYIDTCIKSICNQSFTDYEIILVDDGSTDDSGRICDSWADELENLSVIHTENKGAAAARNTGVRVAKGCYVAFIDADDTVHVDYLKYLYQLADEYNAEVAICGYKKIFEGKDAPAEKELGVIDVLSGKAAMEKLLYQRDIMSVPWGNISMRSLWAHVRFPEGRRVEDYATIYRLYSRATKVVYGSRPLYNYYQRSGSTIYSSEYVKNIDYYKHGRDLINYVKVNYPDCVKSAYSRHFSACFQILSETPSKKEYNKLIKHCYSDIKNLRNTVMLDYKARYTNRIAAVISLVSIRAIHMALRCSYIIKKRNLK